METFSGDESFFAEFVAVGVTENNAGKGCTTDTYVSFILKCVLFSSPASIVDDLLHNTPNVAIPFSEIEGTKLGRCFVMVGVRLELFARAEMINNALVFWTMNMYLSKMRTMA